eukprot:CAMPEP_0167781286 /NCGR_PEP_ID=MMETSP0111_2-20121227/5849_1 /TAXON_ID=91324 /ORGANISM="Lotharella globosa, Strain CCCM811" /LENGTH=553 /DNA_ID=CAMNT_0007671933 /DNA_START=1 /DNA_END=1662 /DNA_ORIENTATION=+
MSTGNENDVPPAAAAKPVARFSLPGIVDSSTGWGPSISEPEELKKLQFKPFNKADKLGRISDWNQVQQYPRRYQQQFSGGTNVFNYKHEDDESSFALVDNTPKPKARKRGKRFNQPRNRRMMNRNRGNNNRFGAQRGGRMGQARRQSKRRQRFYKRRNPRYGQEEGKREPSVDVDEDWPLVKSIDLSSLNVQLTVKEGETVVSCGEVREWDPAYERVNPRNPIDLRRADDVQFFNTTTSVDPVIQDLADSKTGNIFITDTIAAVLMCAAYSTHSWDVIAKKQNGKLYFDKRADSRIDYLTVNENWNESKETETESINHSIRLSEEATFINHNFMDQVLKGPAVSMEKPNPFLKGLQSGYRPAPIAYHYRRWYLGNDRDLVVRCELNGYETRKGKRHYFISRAINEWNSKLSGNIDYRLKLESQSGAVLAAEMKNNKNKLAKWTAKALISGADQLKLGYVTRAQARSNLSHHILLTQPYKAKDFATLMSIKPLALFGALSKIIQAILDQPDGTYLIIRDPMESVLNIHSIPEDAFDRDAGEDDEGDIGVIPEES